MIEGLRCTGQLLFLYHLSVTADIISSIVRSLYLLSSSLWYDDDNEDDDNV